MPIPEQVRHAFLFDFELTNTHLIAEGQVHRCKYCHNWTADPDKLNAEVCPQRDRRRGQRRRVERRTAGQPSLKCASCERPL